MILKIRKNEKQHLDIFSSLDVFSTVKKKGKKNQNIYIIFFIILSENSINASSFMHVDYYPDTIFT